MKTVREYLLYAVVVLLPFQDTILRVPLRQLGISFAIVPLLAMVAVDCLQWLLSREMPVNLKWLAVGVYALIVNGVSLAVFGVSWNGVDLVSKTWNMAVMTGLALYVVFRPDWIRLPHLGAAVKIAFAIAVAGVLIGDLNLFGLEGLVNNPILRYTQISDTRWRGLTAEASTLSLSLGSLGLLSAALSARLMKVLLVLTTALLVSVGASKGALPAMLFVGLMMLLLSKGSRLAILTVVVLVLPLGYLGYQRFQTISASDALSQTTTTATRVTLAAWGLDVIVHNPLGVGFGGFYPVLSERLPHAMDTLSSVFPIPLNFDEVLGYVTSADSASAKSTVMNFGTFFGIPFLIAFAIFVSRSVKACVKGHQPVLLAAILFVTVAISTYTDPISYYTPFVVLGVGWRFYKAMANSPCHDGLSTTQSLISPGEHRNSISMPGELGAKFIRTRTLAES